MEFQFLKHRDGDCGADITWKRWHKASAHGQELGKTTGEIEVLEGGRTSVVNWEW